MLRLVKIGGMCLVMGLLLTACGPHRADLQATIDSLQITITRLSETTEPATTLESTLSPSPPTLPTHTATRKPAVKLITPRPASTVQRPPTITPSRTPRPTRTPTATPTPLPDATVGQVLSNLRSGPGIDYIILAELESGTPLELIGKTSDEQWVQVRTQDDQEGWLFQTLVEIHVLLDTVPVTE